MSILSQIGVVFLIIFIVLVLIRSNRQLVEAAEEGEHFVDEWALREMRRQELLARQELETQRTTNQRIDGPFGFEGISEEEIHEENLSIQERSSHTRLAVPHRNEYVKIPDNVVSIHREPDVRITFVELDDSRRPVRRIPVYRLPFTIGRDQENDLVIDNLTVAKKHCRIIQKDHLIIMEDNGSRNKLAVGGTVAAQTVLKDHLCIGIGEKEFLVEMDTSEIDASQMDTSQIDISQMDMSEEMYHKKAIPAGEVL